MVCIVFKRTVTYHKWLSPLARPRVALGPARYANAKRASCRHARPLNTAHSAITAAHSHRSRSLSSPGSALAVTDACLVLAADPCRGVLEARGDGDGMFVNPTDPRGVVGWPRGPGSNPGWNRTKGGGSDVAPREKMGARLS